MTRDERLQWLLSHWRAFVPALSSAILIALMTMPLLLPAPALPHFAFLAVAAWSLFQPDLMPTWLAFLLGLLTDAVLSLPFGTNATLLPLLTAAIGAIGRRFGPRPFALDWGLIALLAFAYAVLQWRLLCFVGGELPFRPLFLQAVTTTAAWPAAVALCARLQRGWALP
jgi:rod shape-determining protein MreD